MSDIFFFQAEDGIRDLVRSRGLGDVYKRQDDSFPSVILAVFAITLQKLRSILSGRTIMRISVSVSYTHLTLPTSDLV